MGLFFAGDESHPEQMPLTGFDRYRELLERDWGSYLLCGLLTLAGFIPFTLGMLYAILNESLLLAFGSAFLGGPFAGLTLYGLYDLLYRSLRNATGSWWKTYRKVLRKNWKSAVLSGIFFCLFLAISIFLGMLLFWWRESLPELGTILLPFFCILVTTAMFSLYWPQLVLFDQSFSLRLRNCLLFLLKHTLKVFGISLLQVGYWIILVLFLPWSTLLLPVSGIWFILFLANFFLYRDFNQEFGIEKLIQEQFPDQISTED